MKTIKLILHFLIVVYVGAQELNNEFLNSLPDDIKKDLEDRNSRQELSTQDNYRASIYSKTSYKEEILKKDMLQMI